MMVSYKITFKRSAEKDLRSLPQSTVARAMKRIEKLRNDPRPRQVVKLTDTEHLYRIRLGDYRIIYQIDDMRNQITILYVRHRRDVYRGL